MTPAAYQQPLASGGADDRGTMVDLDRARRLREARLAAGYQRPVDAVDRFGWPRSTYFGQENGSRGMSLERLRIYSNAFRVSLDWLAYGRGASDEKIDLGYVARALDRLTDEVATMRDQMIVQGAIITRLEGAVIGTNTNLGNLTVEIRAIRSLLDRALDRVRKTEMRIDQFEDRDHQ